MADEPVDRPPWARLRPLPVVFVVALFAVLWWRRPASTPAAAGPPADRLSFGVAAAGEPAAPQARIESQDGESVAVLAGATMGTRWNVRIVGVAEPARAAELAARTQRALDAVDAAMSTWQVDSELSQLNRAPVGSEVRVSEAMAEVLAVSREVHDASEGAFDVTVAPLVDAWGFGPTKPGAPPDDATLARLRAMTGSGALAFERERRVARRGVEGARIDLSAVAKGYGVDRAAAALREAGEGRVLVEVGGEVVGFGDAPGGRPWRVGVERPDAPPGTVETAAPLRDRAMATSGDYRNFRMEDGVRLSHTIDPRTGRPIAHNLASVSVIAEDCARADAWATAINVLGPVDGMRIARAREMAVMVLIRKDDGSFGVETTAAWDALILAGEGPRPAGRDANP